MVMCGFGSSRDAGDAALKVTRVPFSAMKDGCLRKLDGARGSCLRGRGLGFPCDISVGDLFVGSRSASARCDATSVAMALTRRLNRCLNLRRTFSRGSRNVCSNYFSSSCYSSAPACGGIRCSTSCTCATGGSPTGFAFSCLMGHGGYGAGRAFASAGVVSCSMDCSSQFAGSRHSHVHRILACDPLVPNPGRKRARAHSIIRKPVSLPVHATQWRRVRGRIGDCLFASFSVDFVLSGIF